MNRKLTVKKERLAELTTQELADVAGAASGALCPGQTNMCTTAISCGCPPTYYLSQIFAECVTK